MKDNYQNPIPHLLKANDIEAMPEKIKVHPLNSQAVRHTQSLSDAVGMTHIGVHLVRVEPGKETTQFHFLHQEEEFIYIISGRGIAEIGEEEFEVAAGDFLEFTAPSLPHCMRNPFEEDLVYLMGGERSKFDVCDYPRLKKRLFRVNGDRSLVDWEDLQPF
ncbi:cupin domain-containing protein [Funiculus sociatus GB2-A5]|uniref:Cupin domain-containing protein n=1 Tax=Funiculus sociatus GB2-A5 TaxID=2933946 RepID=A0ABV0JM97_9CYAN|nr:MULTISPECIES: cupin domain-containing protein [unclassified Trichocoleus]MBD1906829.1 cupin domain-containing protein [Trichocoleus sp. FACHB-832]MBD2060884.1 cupin domain-containing protein [Trichocoleus sp. FACHB-6]